MDIVVDFDGTCVTHEFPNVGKEIGAVPVLKALVNNGHRLILFTMRSNIQKPISTDPDIVPEGGNYLNDAVAWFVKHKIPLYGIQTNPEQHSWTTSPKAYGQLIIDDAALGVPLKKIPDMRPYVYWIEVASILCVKGLISHSQFSQIQVFHDNHVSKEILYEHLKA